MNDKAEFAVKILHEYAKEQGIAPRSTSDLSRLEEWLILRLLAKEATPAETRNFDGSKVSWMHNDELGQDGSDSYSKRVIRHNNKLNK